MAKKQSSYIKVVSGTCQILKIYHSYLQSQSIKHSSNTEDKIFTMGYTLKIFYSGKIFIILRKGSGNTS